MGRLGVVMSRFDLGALRIKNHEQHTIRVNLATAIAFFIFIACVLVAVSTMMYLRDPNRKYDIARSGESINNLALEIEDSPEDASSPVTASILQQKIDYLQKEINALSGMGDFDEDDLNDQNLHLNPLEQPAL